MAVDLPYTGIIRRFEKVSADVLDDVLRHCIQHSKESPCYIEVSGREQQRLLFFLEQQIYAAGTIDNDQLLATTIRDFLLGVLEMQDATLTCYEVNRKILHSLLIVFQKKPALKALTSLVDVDRLLDKIEVERKSCIVSALQGRFLAILRYEKGQVTALCHEHSMPVPKEDSFRDDFLVSIYTLSAEKQILISVYDDLLVNFASDAKLIQDPCGASIMRRFLQKPPMLVLRFKEKEIERWELNRPMFKIGRTPDNDIVIDNLAVSRLHALVEEDKGEYYIRDCDSLNGTFLNGRKIGRARLSNRDTITVGKHELLFLRQEGGALTVPETMDEFDRTMIVTPSSSKAATKEGISSSKEDLRKEDCYPGQECDYVPRILERTADGDKIIELRKDILVLGRDPHADIFVNGILVAKRHAEIVRNGESFVIRRIGGLRSVRVAGEKTSETVLKPQDTIVIAGKELIFLG